MTRAQTAAIACSIVLAGCFHGSDGGAGGDLDAAGPDSGTASEDEAAQQAAVCVWEVDGLLEEAGVTPSERTHCGTFNGAQLSAIGQALDCLLEREAMGESAEFTVNNCIDCSIPSTYVSEVGQGIFRVLMEADMFGDEMREARVERCSTLRMAEEAPIECVEPELLYRCEDALR